MRGLIVSIVLVVLCIVGGFAGLFGAQTGITFFSCGALYFVMFGLAWTMRGFFAGKRLQFVDVNQQRSTRLQTPIQNGKPAQTPRRAVAADETL